MVLMSRDHMRNMRSSRRFATGTRLPRVRHARHAISAPGQTPALAELNFFRSTKLVSSTSHSQPEQRRLHKNGRQRRSRDAPLASPQRNTKQWPEHSLSHAKVSRDRRHSRILRAPATASTGTSWSNHRRCLTLVIAPPEDVYRRRL